MNIIEHTGHTIIHGDALETLRTHIPNGTIDLIFADPPYNNGSLYEPILFCVKNPKAYTFNANAILVEAKTGAQRKLIDYRKPVPTVYNSRKVPGNVWEFPRVRYRMEEYEQHPSQKPIALLERIISASTNPDDVILDPFAGTFTASFVAQQLGRRSIGIEIEEEYVGIGLRRLGLTTHFQSKTLTKPAKSTKRRKARTTELSAGTVIEVVV